MINFFLINIFSIIIINQLKISSTKKIIFFFVLNLLIIFKFSNNIHQFFEFLILLICMLFIFVNFYTARYSSLRIKILHDLQQNKKIISEKDLYFNRKRRLEGADSGFMQKKLFVLINFLVNLIQKF